MSKKFHGDSVKNESAKAKKNWRGAPNAPPPLAFIGLNPTFVFQYLHFALPIQKLLGKGIACW